MSYITILTANRPRSLRNCLESLGDIAFQQPASNHIVVADDSNGVASKANAEICRASGSRLGRPVRHVDVSEKQRLVDQVLSRQEAKNDFNRDHLLRALTGHPQLQQIAPGCGANRTATLLLSAGNLLLSLDDDTRAEFGSSSTESPLDDQGFQFHSGSSFRQHYSVSPIDRKSTLDQLVQPVPTVSGTSGFERLSSILCDRSTPRDMVKLSMVGIFGNRWYRNPALNLRASGPIREEVFSSRRRYRQARTSGLAVLEAPVPILTSAVSFVTCCCGMDNRDPLPPLPNAGRQSDTVFAWLVKRMYPDHLTAHLPLSIHHSPDDPRPFSERDYHATDADLGALNVAIVGDLVAKAPRNDPDEALISTGSDLISLSKLGHREWLDYTHTLWLQTSDAAIASLEELLHRYDERPSYWAKDVHEYIDKLRVQTLDPKEAIPRELKEICAPEEATALHRKFLRDYGELLTHWPKIWRVARSINENDTSGEGLLK